jgi:hypothetical protein
VVKPRQRRQIILKRVAVSSNGTSAPVESRSRCRDGHLLLPASPPSAAPSPPAARGPDWLVTLIDFIERATSRTTSLPQHLVMFFGYCLMIVGVPVAGVAWIVRSLLDVGSWPGMTAIGSIAAAGGLTLIMRKSQQQDPTAPPELSSDDQRADDTSEQSTGSAPGDGSELQ